MTMAQVGMNQFQEMMSAGMTNPEHGSVPQGQSADDAGSGGMDGLFRTGHRVMQTAMSPLSSVGVAHGTAQTASPVSRNSSNGPQVKPAQLGSLDVSTMVVVGDSMTAGVTDFSLAHVAQTMSFSSQLARHLGAKFHEPLIQAPGIANSRTHQSVVLPNIGQTTVFEAFPPVDSNSNQSISDFTVSDALHLRPKTPLIHRHNSKQTSANLLIDPRALIEGPDQVLPTQIEAVLKQNPTSCNRS